MAGTVAYAIANNASLAVLVVHEFITERTSDERHARNAADYAALVTRLVSTTDAPIGLVGPLVIPGAPLFENPPPMFIGKISTNRRVLNI